MHDAWATSPHAADGLWQCLSLATPLDAHDGPLHRLGVRPEVDQTVDPAVRALLPAVRRSFHDHPELSRPDFWLAASMRISRVCGCGGSFGHQDFGPDGCDAEGNRAFRSFGAEPHIHKRCQPKGSSLGQQRWPVERSNAWLLEDKRLAPRYDRLGFIVQALLQTACRLLVAGKLVQEL